MPDVKSAVDKHLEHETCSSAKLNAAYATLDAIAEGGELHAGELTKTAGAPSEITTRIMRVVELYHWLASSGFWMASEPERQLAVEELSRPGQIAVVEMLDDDQDVG